MSSRSAVRQGVVNHLPPSRAWDVAALVALGLAAKLAVAPGVAVNGDTGLYLYDAQQILAGRIQFVDFPSRSPLFEHALAAVLWLGDSPLWSARLFMVAISLALGVAVYVFTRQLANHRAGMVAAALFYLTPFTLVWGAWVKTEQAAALTTMLAFIAAMHVIDRERLPWWAIGAVGTLFAFSYLIRRSAIVHIGAFALFVLWYRHRQGHDWQTTVLPAVGVVATAGALVGLGYLALVRGDPALAWQVFDAHTIELVRSGGQGALGWVDHPGTPAVTTESRTGLIAAVCQKCGVNTALVFAQTAMVTLPAVVGGLMYARAGLRRLDASLTDAAVPAVVGVAVAWKLWRDAADMTVIAVASISILSVVVLVVWLTRPVYLEDVWSPKLALPVGVCLTLAVGYLYRDRILYTSYFQDFMPFVATVAAIGILGWWHSNRHSLARAVLVLALIVAALTAGVHADPYQPDSPDMQTHWFTPTLVSEYGDDMDDRLPDGGRVFTAQPLYVLDSEAMPLANLSRRYYLFRGWPDSLQADALEAELVVGIQSGRAPYAINDTNMHEMTSESPALRRALDEEYCPVDAPLYERTGGQLLAHQSTGECS